MVIKYNIICVGSGGTGTYFLKELSRYLLDGSFADSISSLNIFDGDTVEEKNLSRQAFITEDIGQNKAVVMADVLNQSFGTEWRSYAAYLTDISQLDEFRPCYTMNKKCLYMPVIIGCVDNHACRLLLEDFFNKVENVIYFDSANEFSTGEVVFAYKLDGKVVSPCRSWYFPAIKEADLRKRTEMSCEELNDVAPQHIATNMAAGNILLKEVCSFLKDSVMHPGMVTFDLDNYCQEYLSFASLSKEELAA